MGVCFNSHRSPPPVAPTIPSALVHKLWLKANYAKHYQPKRYYHEMKSNLCVKTVFAKQSKRDKLTKSIKSKMAGLQAIHKYDGEFLPNEGVKFVNSIIIFLYIITPIITHCSFAWFWQTRYAYFCNSTYTHSQPVTKTYAAKNTRY